VTDQAHVLLVEDNELVSDALCILFESADHRMSVTASIADTLELIATDPPRLALLDLTLPDGDGLSLVAPLRAAGCETVVALTGHDDPETRARCLGAGCDEVLVKPVPTRVLLAKAAEWLH